MNPTPNTPNPTPPTQHPQPNPNPPKHQSSSSQVRPKFLETFQKEQGGYPDAFPYRQRVLLLYQRMDGVDVCLFCMYVQEYGPECPAPNRWVDVFWVGVGGLGVGLRVGVWVWGCRWGLGWGGGGEGVSKLTRRLSGCKRCITSQTRCFIRALEPHTPSA